MLEGTTALCDKLVEVLRGSRRSCVKYADLPQVMSLASVSFFLFLKKREICWCGVREKSAYKTSVSCFSSLVEAILAVTSIKHSNL